MGGGRVKESRVKLLVPLFKILADFKTEESLRFVNALLPEMQNGVQRLEKLALKAASETIEAEGGIQKGSCAFL